MKILHTSDWHVGKGIRGNSRDEEHIAVLAEIAELAREHEVDAVLVAGDLFDTASPSATSDAIVYKALLDFASTGAAVAVISGNHDNARRLEAIAPILELGRIHMVSALDESAIGDVTLIEGPDGSKMKLAMLPFVSQRGILRAGELMDNDAFGLAKIYSERLELLVKQACSSFAKDTVNVLMTHAAVRGAEPGGGERMAHLVEEYTISHTVFPKGASYVALGHLHKNQSVSTTPESHYCGSPLQLDFGEQREHKYVNLVEAEPGKPAKVTPLKLRAGVPLLTLSGTLEELQKFGEDPKSPDAWLRVTLDQPASAGLGDMVREALGSRVVSIEMGKSEREKKPRASRQGKSPTELFAEYLTEEGIEDPAVESLFNELLTEFWQGAES